MAEVEDSLAGSAHVVCTSDEVPGNRAHSGNLPVQSKVEHFQLSPIKRVHVLPRRISVIKAPKRHHSTSETPHLKDPGADREDNVRKRHTFAGSNPDAAVLLSDSDFVNGDETDGNPTRCFLGVTGKRPWGLNDLDSTRKETHVDHRSSQSSVQGSAGSYNDTTPEIGRVKHRYSQPFFIYPMIILPPSDPI